MKRIPVVSKTILVLSPIEVAIDEMESRVRELEVSRTFQLASVVTFDLNCVASTGSDKFRPPGLEATPIEAAGLNISHRQCGSSRKFF